MSLQDDKNRKLVAAGFENFKRLLKADGKPADSNHEFNELVNKIMGMQHEVQAYMKPMIDAGALRDKKATEDMIFRLYLTASAKFSKSELEGIVAWMFTGTAMEGLYPERLTAVSKIPQILPSVNDPLITPGNLPKP